MKYITAEFDLSQALQLAQMLRTVPGKVATAQQRAVSTLRRQLRTQARRDIQQEYRLTATRINAGLSARNTDGGVKLVGAARGVNAEAFGARWTRRRGYHDGAVWAARRSDAPQAHAGAFIGVGRSGNRLVFKRRGTSRLPLESLYGPSIGQMLKHGQRPDRLAEFAERIITQELTRQLGVLA